MLGVGILVVEDDAAVLAYVTAVLEAFSIRRFFTADSEKEALLRWREHAANIDVLLCDLSVAGSSGETIASSILRDKPGLQVIFMTGSILSADEMSARIGKTVKVLLKPFIPSQLMEALRTAAGAQSGVLDARDRPTPTG